MLQRGIYFCFKKNIMDLKAWHLAYLETDMRNFLIAAAALTTVAAPAFAAPMQSFQADGETYTYSAARDATGTVLLTGAVQETGTPFKLTVHGRRVEGTMGEQAVSFLVSKQTIAELAQEVPADAPVQTASASIAAAN